MQYLDALPGLAARLGRRAVAIVEQGIEQRRGRSDAAATLGQRQWRMLMTHQRGQALMRGANRGAQVLIAQIQTQRQGIDEDPQRPFGGLGPQQTAHQHGAEDHALAASQASQYSRPAQVEQAGNADAQRACLIAQPLAQQWIQRQREFADVAALSTEVLQVVRQCRFIQVGQHAAEERFMLGFADAQQCLRHVVAERHRGAQRFGLPGQTRLNFVAYHLQRAVVHGNVVKH